jgi:hypothetical protein
MLCVYTVAKTEQFVLLWRGSKGSSEQFVLLWRGSKGIEYSTRQAMLVPSLMVQHSWNYVVQLAS